MKYPFTAGQFCDAACGGGGCDSCGEGDSCTDGALGKVSSSETIIEAAFEMVDEKNEQTGDIKKEVRFNTCIVLLPHVSY